MNTWYFRSTALLEDSPLAALTAEDLARVFPEGGLAPASFLASARNRHGGFLSLVKKDPELARILSDAREAFSERVVDSRIRQLGPADAARCLREALPERRRHPNQPNYWIFKRSTNSPRNIFPEIHLCPTANYDFTGAMMAAAVGAHSNKRTRIPSRKYAEPNQIIDNQQPLKSLDGLIVFSAHGYRNRFRGLSTEAAATMVAEQIAEAASEGIVIDKCLLDCCHQRDRRLFGGVSNAMAFERALHTALERLKIKTPVTVFAAEYPGELRGFSQWVGRELRPTRFTPAATGAKFHLDPEEIVLCGLLGVGLLFARDPYC